MRLCIVIDSDEVFTEDSQRRHLGDLLARFLACTLPEAARHSRGRVVDRHGQDCGSWTLGEAAQDGPAIHLPPFVVAVGPGAVLIADAFERSVQLVETERGGPRDVEIFARDLVAAANRKGGPTP